MNIEGWPKKYKPAVWQLDFVHKYIEQPKAKSLLVAAPGTGKTITALYAAHLMREQKTIDALIVLNDYAALREQWKYVASEVGFNLSDSIEQYREGEHDGVSLTVQSLNDTKRVDDLMSLSSGSTCFGIVDESHRTNKRINEIVSKVLDSNVNNKFLFISGTAALTHDMFDEEYRFDSEYIFQDSVLKAPATKIEIAHFSPSFSRSSKADKQKCPN